MKGHRMEIVIEHMNPDVAQKLLDEFYETVSFDRTPGDWRKMPETEPPED